jgi:glycosyltransferase involved in cell wall biosynthesis
MDYRLPLFGRMQAQHDVRYFFLAPGDDNPPAPTVYSTHRQLRISLAPRAVTWADARNVMVGIRDADVFVTSFLGNAYTVLGGIAARLSAKPVVVWEETHEFADTLRGRARRGIYRLLSSLADTYFVLGTAQRDALLSLGVAAERIFIANEVPGRDYQSVASTPVALDLDPARPVLLYLGRLIKLKGVDILLHAFASARRHADDAALVIAGDGPERAPLQSLAAALGLTDHVRFVGHVTDPEHKRYLFERARVLVVPSRRLHGAVEGGPLVVPEALSAGLPVVGTDALGSSTAMIRPDVNGLIVAEASVDALAAALGDVLLHDRFDRREVRRSFEALPGHAFQAAQLNAAIESALRRRR